jgi:hypothetical protein
MTLKRSDLWSWLQSILPLGWDAATQRLILKSGGLQFGDSTVQTSAASVQGTGAANQVTYWSSTSAIAGSTKLTFDPTTGNVTSTGTVKGDKLQVTGANPNILNPSGSIALALASTQIQASVINGTSGIAFRFTNAGAPPTGGIVASFEAGGVNALQVVNNGKLLLPSTDSSGTPGAATINKPSGKSAIAAGASSVTITNNTVTASSIVIPVLMTSDATLTSIQRCVVSAGSFTITGNAAATAATTVGWWVLN